MFFFVQVILALTLQATLSDASPIFMRKAFVTKDFEITLMKMILSKKYNQMQMRE